VQCIATNLACLDCSGLIDLSEETLKALAMPSRRPTAILQHLERQAEALTNMSAKIRDQLRRLQIEERYLKKKLSAAPLEVSDIESPAPTRLSMDVDVAPVPENVTMTQKTTQDAKKTSLLVPQEEEDEEDDDEVQLPASLRGMRSDSYMDDDDEEDEDEDATMSQVRMILASQPSK